MAVSIEELHEVVSRIGLSLEQSARHREETERALAKIREEAERALAESRAESDRAYAKSRAEAEQRQKETDRAIAKSRAETERALLESREANERVIAKHRKEAEQHRKAADRYREEGVWAFKELVEQQKITEAYLDRLSKNIGGLNNSIGEIVEMIVIPGLKEKMREFQHNFFMASPGKEFSGPDGGKLTEVDLLLENCDEVMVVEVKTQVSIKWLDRHLKRLELLRKHEKITGMTGKTMYAAMAGIGFDADARDLALQNGMYLIEIEEEQERVKVIQPSGKIGTW
jgi:flagellar biosynthesis GTPase FlhF